MECPRCGSRNTKVSHSYRAGKSGMTQRRTCSDCDVVFTTAVVVVSVNPQRGEGAKATAKRMKKAPLGASSGHR